MSIQMILIVLIGAAVFVVGTTNLRACLKMKKSGMGITGKVLSTKLIQKRDGEGQLIQSYYEMMVQFCENNKNYNQKINSTTEYFKGDEVKLTKSGGKFLLSDGRSLSVRMALGITLAGMVLATFPVLYEKVPPFCGEWHCWGQ